MRKKLVAVAALTIALAVGVSGIAWGVINEPIQATVSPKKLPKKKKQPIKLRIASSARDASDPSARPSPTTVVNYDLDKDLKVFTTGLKTCNPSAISTASTATALQKCGKARISVSGSVPWNGRTTPSSGPLNAAVVRPEAGNDIEAVVTAFNGKPSGGSPTLVIHTVNAVTGTTVIIAKVIKGPAGYGKTISATTPPLAGGLATLIDFTTTIKKTYSYRGKKRSVVSSSCRDRKLKFQIRSVRKDGTTTGSTSQQTCKQKG
jgi:hypothetical protein